MSRSDSAQGYVLAPSASKKKTTSRCKPVLWILAILLASAGVVYGWNHVAANGPLQDVLDEDPRNAGIEMRAHFKLYVQPSTLVIDVAGVSSENSRADLFRVLLQYAERLKDESFDTVVLAFDGDARFVLDGGHFALIGAEYGSQNPVFTMRTFPEHLRLPNGDAAYGTWTGGILGVTGKQMEDFSDFIDRWAGIR